MKCLWAHSTHKRAKTAHTVLCVEVLARFSARQRSGLAVLARPEQSADVQLLALSQC